jgi:hypothetical protein
MKGGAISAINRVVLHSGLTRDPELRHTPDGAPVVTLRLGFTLVDVVEGEWRDLPEGTSWRPAGIPAGAGRGGQLLHASARPGWPLRAERRAS